MTIHQNTDVELAVAHSDDYAVYDQHMKTQREQSAATDIIECYTQNGIRIGEFSHRSWSYITSII